MLTTPIKGLWLGVSPYMGSANLHFSLRFSKDVGALIDRDPARDAFRRRHTAAIGRWWDKKGRFLYVFGRTKPEDLKLLDEIRRFDDGTIFGLWERNDSPELKRLKQPWKKVKSSAHALIFFIMENHPEVRLPKMTRRERNTRISRYNIGVRAALKAAMKDLLSPTTIRDISLSIFGDVERDPLAIERYSKQPDSGRFTGAGYPPKHWFVDLNEMVPEPSCGR